MNRDRKEKIERTTFVLGIYAASVIGFVISLYANIYYDIFLTSTRKFEDYSQPAFVIPTLVLILTSALLSFLVYDYKNELNLDSPFFKRFFDYFDNVFWFSRLMKKINSWAVTLGRWLLNIVVGATLLDVYGLKGLIFWVLFIVTVNFAGKFLRSKYKAQKQYSTIEQ